jgi:hypothetical protein
MFFCSISFYSNLLYSIPFYSIVLCSFFSWTNVLLPYFILLVFHSVLFSCVISCFVLFLFNSVSVCTWTHVPMHMVMKVNFFHHCFTSHLRAITVIFFFHRDSLLFPNGSVCISGIRTHALHISRYPYLNFKCSSEVCLCFLYVWLFCLHWRGLMSSPSRNFSNWV